MPPTLWKKKSKDNKNVRLIDLSPACPRGERGFLLFLEAVQLCEIGNAVDPGPMTVGPEKLKSVSTNNLESRKRKRFWAVLDNRPSHPTHGIGFPLT